ncbi:MAG: nicotinate-nucleotide adenylyltransferase [Cyanobium sp. 49614_E6]|nr:nicotinate-nucleotide adenylyltransferase [Cyanobium sp. 49614_E6]
MAAIALLGTSADPPTCGHRALLEGLLTLYPLVATWASDNPLKQHGAPLEIRVQLLAALVAAIANPRLSLEQQLSSPWSIETLERAAQRWPDHELVFVVGSDLLPQIPHWRQADQLLANVRLAVAPRQGWPLQQLDLERLRQAGAKIELLPLQIPASASRLVRQAPGGQTPLAQAPGAQTPDEQTPGGQTPRGQPDLSLVPAELLPLLYRHRLYGLAQPPPTT